MAIINNYPGKNVLAFVVFLRPQIKSVRNFQHNTLRNQARPNGVSRAGLPGQRQSDGAVLAGHRFYIIKLLAASFLIAGLC